MTLHVEEDVVRQTDGLGVRNPVLDQDLVKKLSNPNREISVDVNIDKLNQVLIATSREMSIIKLLVILQVVLSTYLIHGNMIGMERGVAEGLKSINNSQAFQMQLDAKIETLNREMTSIKTNLLVLHQDVVDVDTKINAFSMADELESILDKCITCADVKTETLAEHAHRFNTKIDTMDEHVKHVSAKMNIMKDHVTHIEVKTDLLTDTVDIISTKIHTLDQHVTYIDKASTRETKHNQLRQALHLVELNAFDFYYRVNTSMQKSLELVKGFIEESLKGIGTRFASTGTLNAHTGTVNTKIDKFNQLVTTLKENDKIEGGLVFLLMVLSVFLIRRCHLKQVNLRLALDILDSSEDLVELESFNYYSHGCSCPENSSNLAKESIGFFMKGMGMIFYETYCIDFVPYNQDSTESNAAFRDKFTKQMAVLLGHEPRWTKDKEGKWSIWYD